MFLSCTTVSADWGAVFNLENSSWLLLDGKLCVILFIVGDLVVKQTQRLGFRSFCWLKIL